SQARFMGPERGPPWFPSPSGLIRSGPGSSLDRGSRELRVVEAVVRGLSRQQLLVGALFDDMAVLHHHDQVGVADGGEPVGDDETGAIAAKCRGGLLHQ